MWDVALAVVLATLLAADAATGGDRSGGAAAVAAVLSGAAALPLIVRTRAPEAALAGTLVLGSAAVAAADVPMFVLLPAIVALYSVGAAGRWPRTLGAVTASAAVVLALRASSGAPVLSTAAVADVLFVVVPAVLGESIAARRASLRERRRREAETELRRQEQELRRLDEERIRIARDVHDGVGHALAAINIQAGAAAAVAQTDPAEVGAALRRIRETCRVAMAELRGTLEALRTPGAGAEVPLTSARLEEIAEVARAAGVRVQSHEDLPADLDPAVAGAAYRIVQEAVTNVVRHAHASSCRIGVGCVDCQLELRVEDDGDARVRRQTGHTGFGLAGMCERAEALGGTFTAGPTDHGWQVLATLPLDS
jgi:signal transduction histidine kinase